ncbi:MAG: hypothetical protein ACOC16_00830 [Nanoarchaeota archaeon]
MGNKISARFIIEIAGKPVENVEKALNLVLDKIKTDKNISLKEDMIEPPEYDKKTSLYSGFMEVMIKFKTTNDILNFIMDYTPTSVEIEDPEKISFTSNELTGVLNDFSIKILDSQNKIRHLNAYVHMLNNKLKEKETK